MAIGKAGDEWDCDLCEERTAIVFVDDDQEAMIALCADCLAEVCKVAGWEVIDE